MKQQLDSLVTEMVERGILFDEARREFEKRFIAQVLGKVEGNLTRTADTLGIHRNTLTRKMGRYKIKKRNG